MCSSRQGLTLKYTDNCAYGFRHAAPAAREAGRIGSSDVKPQSESPARGVRLRVDTSRRLRHDDVDESATIDGKMHQ